eukprot:5595483-Alexandrium_andersonii.AAC.1
MERMSVGRRRTQQVAGTLQTLKVQKQQQPSCIRRPGQRSASARACRWAHRRLAVTGARP